MGGNYVKALRTFVIALMTLLAGAGAAHSQKWTALKHQPSFNAGAMLLLTDGRVLVHAEQDSPSDWYTLTPDVKGSYLNGKWKKVASLPSGYAPLYFGSAVLTDGRVMVEGGEYNNGGATWTNQGAIYDPLKNKWKSVTPPSGWSSIGDAQAELLTDGTYMQANCCSQQSALLNSKNLTWTSTGTGKFDVFDEEGWTLLPDGNTLTVDAYVFKNDKNGKNYEIYDAGKGTWSVPGTTPVQLWDSCGSNEEGPDVLRPDGTVFVAGANTCGAGHTAIYDSSTGTWTAGPDFPGTFDVADGPGALETNGKVLVMASPGFGGTGAQFFEWDGSNLTKVVGPPNASTDSSFYGHFLELPTGELMFTDFSADVELFKPKGKFKGAWRPKVGSVPTTLTRGSSYRAVGKQFNGMSQGAFYGDDYQSATNYPLVRITNTASGHVFYCRTHDHSNMGVQTGSLRVSTHFDVPSGMETGASTLEVVTNGIPSLGVAVTVQ